MRRGRHGQFEAPLNDADPRDSRSAKKAVQAFDEGAGLVLKQDCCARFRNQRQHGPFRSPLEAQRPGHTRDVASGNLFPPEKQ
jgi:hypothetical protein